MKSVSKCCEHNPVFLITPYPGDITYIINTDRIYISPTLSPTYYIINVSNKVGDKKLLNSRRSHILEEIRNNPNATQAQLPQIIGIGLSVIENNIGFFTENSSIERIGSNKTGYRKVKE